MPAARVLADAAGVFYAFPMVFFIWFFLQYDISAACFWACPELSSEEILSPAAD